MLRFDPKLPVHAMKTYALVQPLRTHTREVTCREVECRGYRLGFSITCDVKSELGQRQAYYIRMHSGRAYTQARQPNTSLVTFTFKPGQQCFATHRVPVWREPLYVVRGGDWRGNPRGERMTHAAPAHWVDDFATHQDRLHTVQQRG